METISLNAAACASEESAESKDISALAATDSRLRSDSAARNVESEIFEAAPPPARF